MESAEKALNEALASGAAAECFGRMVKAQGGPAGILDRPDDHLPAAAVVKPVTARGEGFVQSVDVKSIGLIVAKLGGGRRRAEDRVDHSVGISGLCEPGFRVSAGSALAVIHAPDEQHWQDAANRICEVIELVDVLPGEAHRPVIWDRIAGEKH